MSDSPRFNWFGLSSLILFVAGVGFFALSVIVLGVLPGLRMDRAMQTQAPKTAVPYTPSEERGRDIFAVAGCDYCHSEQVRFTNADERRWGAPTVAWETKYDTPHLWGTRRIGPDLARETGVRSDDWQLVHLFDPRDIVPESVMPGYPWLFNGSAGKPRQEALDLVAYLNTLGRARRQAGADAPTGSPLRDGLDANSSRSYAISPGTSMPTSALAGNLQHGDRLFVENCSGCHGKRGDGESAAAQTLRPRPANLTAFYYDTSALAAILHNGVAGSSMPAWRDLNAQQIADLSVYVHQLHNEPQLPPPDTQLIARGARLYAQSCVACHGVGGEGNGPASIAFTPRPFNFHQLKPDAAEIDRVLREGVPGSGMPPFAGLNAVDRAATAAYVRSLYGATAEQGH